MHESSSNNGVSKISNVSLPTSRSITPLGGFSIRVASKLTGIPIDTLRMWERRYGFPKPVRTSGGNRAYTEKEIELLKLIAVALERGYRPSEVVGRSREELLAIASKVGEIKKATRRAETDESTATPTIESILDALLKDEPHAVQAQLRKSALALGPRQFVTDLAQPIMLRVGELWERGALEVRHEHLMSEFLSTQLRILLAAFGEIVGPPHVVLATLPNESHGLGLEMTAVYLAVHRATPHLIGADTPPRDIVEAAKAFRADVVGICITDAADLQASRQHVEWMLGELPRRVEVWIGGAAGEKLGLEALGLSCIKTWSELDDVLLRFRASRVR